MRSTATVGRTVGTHCRDPSLGAPTCTAGHCRLLRSTAVAARSTVLRHGTARCNTARHGATGGVRPMGLPRAQRYKGLTASLLGLTHGALQLPIYEALKDAIRQPADTAL